MFNVAQVSLVPTFDHVTPYRAATLYERTGQVLVFRSPIQSTDSSKITGCAEKKVGEI